MESALDEGGARCADRGEKSLDIPLPAAPPPSQAFQQLTPKETEVETMIATMASLIIVIPTKPCGLCKCLPFKPYLDIVLIPNQHCVKYGMHTSVCYQFVSCLHNTQG